MLHGKKEKYQNEGEIQEPVALQPIEIQVEKQGCLRGFSLNIELLKHRSECPNAYANEYLVHIFDPVLFFYMLVGAAVYMCYNS